MTNEEIRAVFMAEVDRRIATSPARYADQLRLWRPLLAAIPADQLAGQLESYAKRLGIVLVVGEAEFGSEGGT